MSLLNAIKRHAAAMDVQAAQPGWGTVTSYDPATHTARVMLQPSGVLSGSLPILVQHVGAGWGMHAAPDIGAQCFLVPDSGDANQMVILGFANSELAPTPKVPAAINGAPVPLSASDGPVFVSKSGAVLRLCADGSVFILGDLHVQGDIYDKRGSLQRLRHNFNQHRDVDSHGDTAGLNDHQDPE